MNRGRLSEYFSGIAIKKLSAVESDLNRSHQHELNGVTELKDIFGLEKCKIEATYIYLDDDEENIKTDKKTLTWYDSRENHPTRTEYRMYFASSPVTEQMQEGDVMIVGKRSDNGEVMFIVAREGTTAAGQLLWLFGADEETVGEKFSFKDIGKSNIETGIAARIVLDELGIEMSTKEGDNYIEEMLEKFGLEFPKTVEFSGYARSTITDISAVESPDDALLMWIEREEEMFRALEKQIVSKRLKEGFGNEEPDVDAFTSFSLSVQNRRKARMGQALENHLEVIFTENGIAYSRGKVTEHKSKPDFIFPGIDQYLDSAFPAEKLTMLGSKSTCKDRWRQVLAEAARIEKKHLLTLEPSISEHQTDEMSASNLQLVLPKQLHKTYTETQQGWLMDLQQFLKLVKQKQ